MTFNQYVEDKYGVSDPKIVGMLMEIERHNHDKPKNLTYKVKALEGRELYNEQARLDNIAAQVTVTGGKVKPWRSKYPDLKPRPVRVRTA